MDKTRPDKQRTKTASNQISKMQKDSRHSLFGTNLERAGNHNQRVILQAIRTQGPTLRSELVDKTGLTFPSVANITNRLIEKGMLLKIGKSSGARGQPATKLAINPDGAYSIGLNIDRDHLTVVALDFMGNVRAKAIQDIAFASPVQAFDFFRTQLRKIVDTRVIAVDRLTGIGVAIPDDLGTKYLPHQPESYSEWSSVRIDAALADIVPAPVYIENDAAAAAIGEMQFGHGLRSQSFVYVLLSAGLGGGLVINGQYFRGANGRSGEIGYLPLIHPYDNSLTNLTKTLGDAVIISSLLDDLKSNTIDVDQLEQLASLDDDGQAIVDGWISKVADYLHMPLLSMTCGIDPEAIYIGGRLPSDIIERLCDRINERLKPFSPLIPWLPVVERAALAVDASAIGAAILPFNEQLLPNRNVLMTDSH